MNLTMKKLLSGLLVLSLTILVGCAASAPPAVGVWDVEMDTPLGAIGAVLVINEDGTGSMHAEALGGDPAPFSGVMFDGNTLSFEAELDAMGQLITLEFSGTVDGDSLNGEFGSDFGSFGVTGTRQ